jgi:hypothetical protein
MCLVGQVLKNLQQDVGLDAEVKKKVVECWESRWDMLSTELHGAGYCLDPEFWSDKGLGVDNSKDSSVKALRDAIRRVLPTAEEQKAARASYTAFRNREGEFGDEDAMSDADSMPAWQWWQMYGEGHPELQKVAMRVLAQVTSACSCERAWSTYDFIHNKRRNRLRQDRARDLVYVFNNGRLVDKLRYGQGATFIGWDEEEDEEQQEPAMELDSDEESGEQ